MDSTSELIGNVIFVIGETGTGKSELSLFLAEALNGEIINADAMQCYTGLNIATNKVSDVEQKGIPHHLLSFLPPTATSFGVREYVQMANEKILEIQRRKRVPVVVGGTHYYIQELLFGSYSWSDSDWEEGAEDGCMKEGRRGRDGLQLVEDLDPTIDGEAMYAKLLDVDPIMARKLHPKDIRRVRRALEIWETTGTAQSQWVKRDVKKGLGGSTKTDEKESHSMPRSKNIAWVSKSLIIQIACDPSVLKTRLDARVDRMVERGLFDETLSFLEKYFKDEKRDVQIGLLQAIGWKELLPAIQGPEEDRKLAVPRCVESLKVHTSRYAKKQRQWIENRFIKRGVPIFVFNGSDLGRWEADVCLPALQLAKEYLRATPHFDPWGVEIAGVLTPVKMEKAVCRTDQSTLEEWKKIECKVCGVVLNGENEWKQHMKSRMHKKRRKRRKRIESGHFDETIPWSKK